MNCSETKVFNSNFTFSCQLPTDIDHTHTDSTLLVLHEQSPKEEKLELNNE